MKRFRNTRSWTRYRTILAEEFGIRLSVEPEESERRVRGHRVRIDEWPAQGSARGVVILVHGGGGNGRVLAPFAEPLAADGWRVLAPDLPGYGLTKPAKGYRDEYAEWPDVIAEIAQSEPGPVILAGLSMGGLTAMLAAQKAPTVRGVIVTTLMDLSQPEVFVKTARWRWLGRLSLLSMAIAPWLFDRLVLPLSLAVQLNAMSSNKRMQDYFLKDPLIGGRWKAARFFRTIHQHRVQSWALECPLLLAHPGADAWTPTSLSLPAFEKVEGRKRFVELSNGAHLPAEQPAYDELIAQMKAFAAAVR